MRRRTTVGGLVLAVWVGGALGVAQDVDEIPAPDLAVTMQRILAEWPKRLRLPEEWTRPDPATAVRPGGRPPLPAPTMTEPFEIGEALNDPSRVEDAVVSLLALMRIGIVPDGAPMPALTAGVRLRLTEAEARGLVAMGIADAEEAATSPDGPSFSFADLHRSLAPIVRGVSVEQLAERYQQAYAQNPEWLVPRVLQGQPVEPDATFLRTQLWLLLADAVAPRAAPTRAAANAARLVLARSAVQPQVHLWGGGAIVPDPRVLDTPDARFTTVEWQEILTRLPLFANGILALTPARAHEKHRGQGNAVTIQGRQHPNPPAMVSSATGRILLTPAPSSYSLAGLSIAWNYEDKLLQHGAMSVPQWTQTTIDASGTAQLTFTPKNEVAEGQGELMRDSGRVDAYMSPRSLFMTLYHLPPQTQDMQWGELNVGSADLTIEWHARDTVHVRLINEYRVRIVGALQRDGVDGAFGTLELAPDGTYRGQMRLATMPARTVLPGLECRHGEFIGTQMADVIGTPITEQDSRGQREGAFYNAVRSSPKFFGWDSGTAANYLQLLFYPTESPRYLRKDKAGTWVARTRPRCYDELGGVIDPNGVRTPKFIPLNAAQWTVEHAGYAVAIPAPAEELAYRDMTGAAKFFQSNKGIAGAIQQLAAGTDATWYVWMNAPPDKR